jgi:hypothetical protein
MELLLNLAWLLLGIPAYLLWRRTTAKQRHGIGALQCLLALGCALVMLFPVVSATDDLHAMRAEMEESPVSKHGLRQAGNARPAGASHHSQNPPALLTFDWSFPIAGEQGIAALSGHLLISAFDQVFPPGRAPPLSLLA